MRLRSAPCWGWVLCSLLMSGAVAADIDGTPFAIGGIDLVKDSDEFRTENYTAGGGVYLNRDNNIDRFGYRHSETHFSTPGFSRHGTGNTLFGALALDAIGNGELSGELTRYDLDKSGSEWLGWTQVSGQPIAPFNVELRYERNLVDSEASLSQGITYDLITLAADYQFTSRLNVAGVVGHFDFSDGNERPLYRTKINWLLSERIGLSTYVRARKYSNTDPYNGNYFAPEEFEDWLAGFGIRYGLPSIRGALVGHIDWGRQDVDGDASPARTWRLRFESRRGLRWSYALTAGYDATAGVGGGADYEYRYTSASVTWAF